MESLGRVGWLGAWVAIAGCAELPPLSATVTIEETGEVIGSPAVHGLSYGPNDNVFIDLDNGARLFLALSELDGPLPIDTLIPFDGDPLVGGPRRVEVSYQELPTMPGSDVIPETCSTDARSEGGVTLRARSRDAEGRIDGLVGSIRVRFVGCERTADGLALGDITFLVELPASSPAR